MVWSFIRFGVGVVWRESVFTTWSLRVIVVVSLQVEIVVFENHLAFFSHSDDRSACWRPFRQKASWCSLRCICLKLTTTVVLWSICSCHKHQRVVNRISQCVWYLIVSVPFQIVLGTDLQVICDDCSSLLLDTRATLCGLFVYLKSRACLWRRDYLTVLTGFQVWVNALWSDEFWLSEILRWANICTCSWCWVF